jgi:hypothetical protein
MAYYYNLEEVESRARAELPCRMTDVQEKAKQYQDAVFSELKYSFYLLANMEQINQNQLPFNLTRIRKALGRYGKNPQKYWWDWLHANYPIVKIVKKGNSYQKGVSMVEIDIPLDIILAGNNSKEIFDAIYSKYDADSEVHCAPIDSRSLKNYIAATAAENNPNKTIQQNLKDARLILMIAEQTDGVLPQIVNKSNFGRTYYQGVNLQSVHKTVREAALGRCHAIDINASVFNWKYAVVPFNNNLTYTRELIKDKDRTRKYLAKVAFNNTEKWAIDLIKRTLTAISFGARGESRCWFKNEYGKWTQGAISDIIRSKEIRTRLFDDPWMKQFMLEQDRINDWIYKNLVETVNEKLIPEKYLDDVRTEKGRISKTKLISFAYQRSEQEVMKAIHKWSNAEQILQVHDGAYYKTKPDMKSMQTILQEYWPLASLSYEEIERYSYTNIIDIEEHKQSIIEEEKRANDGVVPFRHSVNHNYSQTYDPHSEPDWDLYQQNQMEEYYQHFPKERPLDPNMPEFARNRIRGN